MPINVVLADKFKIIRDSVKYKLEYDKDIKIVGNTDNGYECLNLINKYNPNVIVLDTELESLSGLKVLGIMKEQDLYNKVLFMSGETDMSIFNQALQMGCDGFVTKNVDCNELKKAIYSVYKGEKYIQNDLKDFLKEKVEPTKVNEKLASLTKRELEILKLLASGLTNKEISAHFDISDRTVKNHIFSLFKKIQVNDRTQAAVYAIRNGVVNVNR